MHIRAHVAGGLAAVLISVLPTAAASGAQSAQGEIIPRDILNVQPLQDLPRGRVNGFPVEVNADAEPARVETICVVSFDVEASGRVDRRSIEADCGDEAFVAQAVGMAQEWTFEPLIVDGAAVPRRGEVRQVRFRVAS